MKIAIAITTIFLISAGIIGKFYIDEVRETAFNEGVNSVKPIVKIDTVKIPYEKTVYIRKTEVDTMFVVKTDTVMIKGEVEQYTATGFYEDSTIYIRAKYFSPVPLSEDGYFRIGFNYECPEITKTIYIPEPIKPKSFWDNFGYGLTIGAGVGVITGKPDIFLGFGINYDFSR